MPLANVDANDWFLLLAAKCAVRNEWSRVNFVHG